MGRLVDADNFDAVLFDLDGVLTTTRRMNVACWKRAFDEFLADWDARHGTVSAAFSESEDYLAHIDGRPRQEGVRSFLLSRGIELPDGDRDAPPGEETLWGLGNRKQGFVEEAMETQGVDAFPGSVAWLRELRARGLLTAVVSTSRNTAAVLRHAGIEGLFEVRVDGTTLEALGLAGKPAPDLFLEAARQLGVEPARAVVVEDALRGVEAGRAGGFGLVIGVARHDEGDALRERGADVIVSDLGELVIPEDAPLGPREHRLVSAALRILAAGDDYPVEPFRIVEQRHDPEFLPQTEALFAVSNGYLGMRGTTDETPPADRPGTLLNGFHETWPIVYPEDAYGFARTGQTILNVPDGMIVRVFVDDEPLSCDHCECFEFERALDMARGTLDRTVVWRMVDGRRFRVRSSRLVSFERRHLAAMRYEITALDAPARLTFSSELLHQQPRQDDDPDPRRGRVLSDALVPAAHDADDEGTGRATLAFHTARSGLRVVCGMDHDVTGLGPDGSPDTETFVDEHLARLVARVTAAVGDPIVLVKYLAYHFGEDPVSDLAFRTAETLRRAREVGWHQIVAEQQARVSEFWSRSDVVIENAPMTQQAVRFNLFTLFQATARVEGLGVPAKGLTGTGYEGHSFWDTEIYVLPFLVHTAPAVARGLLLHRHRMLGAARARARELGHVGACYPWRTIRGEEASAFYAAGTAQYHINADIAYAIDQYVRATGDVEFLFRYGAEMLVETARLWRDLGFFSPRRNGRFVINGVTGPDEYSTVVDNNVYTNLMARNNLRLAASTVRRLRAERPELHAGLVARTGLLDDELEQWELAADLMYVPYDKEAEVHLQDDGFLDREPWDFEHTPAEHHPLLLHYHPLVIYRHQVIKQADVVLATVLLSEEFTPDERRRIFEFYDPLTSDDSSLSESIQSIAAAEAGAARAAEEYLVDAISVDLADENGNLRDGLHVASAGGVWMALVLGLAGMRDRGDVVSFRPMLPTRMTRLHFPIRRGETVLDVDIRAHAVTYRVRSGPAIPIRHAGALVTVEPGLPVQIPGYYRASGDRDT
jgi:alpha,alpha-trehalose phosphorylase